MKKLKRIELDLELVLRNLSESYINPNCYEEVSKIRAKFSDKNKDKVVIEVIEEGKIEMVWEDKEII